MNSLRFARRLIPRFGTLSLVATMLLVVSGAGWWKVHRDLYREERAVLAALAKEGCETLQSTALTRPEELGLRANDESENGYFDRVCELVIWGSPSPELLRRTAMLPHLEVLEIRWNPRTSDRGAPSPSYYAHGLVNDAAPAFAAPEIVEAELQRPLATGEPMNEAEQASTLAAIQSSWETPATTPRRFVRSVQEFEFGLVSSSRSRETFSREGESTLTYFWWDSHDLMSDDGRSTGHGLQIDDGQFLHDLRDGSGGWRLSSRYGETTRGYEENRYDAKDELMDWSVELPSRTDPSELAYVERVERIDDVRVRLFFGSFVRSIERPGNTQRTPIRDASVILREDLDWLPESIRETEEDSIATQSEERRYARVGGHVLPIEILSGPIAEEDGWVTGINERTQFAWSIDPTFEPGTFSPNRFLAEPILPPQELPLWRWHYGTFAFGVALFTFLAGRCLASFFGRSRRTTVAESPTPGS